VGKRQAVNLDELLYTALLGNEEGRSFYGHLGFAEARGFLLFSSGDHAEQVTVGLGTQDFCPAAIAMQKTCRESR
jgi:hypothetical protein